MENQKIKVVKLKCELCKKVLRPIKGDWTVRKFHKTCNKDNELNWCMAIHHSKF